MDPSSSSNAGAQSRQKRVLPSRSRRGGPGVGTCDADVMILETLRRKLESESLIPVNTPFLLTTNPALVAGSSDNAELGINTFANERYFDRPDVLKAYREQATIQTPEFDNVSGNPSVGGRMRPRGEEEGAVDTSDAAYEKRHRKYETFEKRLRLREKEKLKHEQYKLKERIDQLRAMDGSAFLSLPAPSFSAPNGLPVTEDEDAWLNANGSAAYSEGERRRKEMLDIALMLEERYRYLLPPDRVRKPVAPRNESVSLEPEVPSHPAKGRKAKEGEALPEPDEQVFIESVQKETERLKIKLKVPQRSNSTSTPHAPVPGLKSSTHRKPRASMPPNVKQGAAPRKIRASNAPRPSVPLYSSPGKIEGFNASTEHEPDIDVGLDIESEEETGTGPRTERVPRIGKDGLAEVEYPNEPFLREEAQLQSKAGSHPVRKSSPDAAEHELVPRTPGSNPDIAVLDPASRDTTAALEEGEVYDAHEPAATEESESISAARPLKRVKRSAATFDMQDHTRSSIPPIESISAAGPHRSRSSALSAHPSQKHVSYAGAAGQAERTNSLLMVAAIRNSSGGSRKAQRHVTAFGVKVPQEIGDVMNFELPPWILLPDEAERRVHETPGPQSPVVRDTQVPQNVGMEPQKAEQHEEAPDAATDAVEPASDSMDVSPDGPDEDATANESAPASPDATNDDLPESEDDATKEDGPAHEDGSIDEGASVRESSVVDEKASVEESSSIDESAPANEDASVKENSPVDENGSANEDASVRETSPAEENAPATDDALANEDVP